MLKKQNVVKVIGSIFLVFLLSLHVEAGESSTAGTFFFVYGNVKVVKNNGKVQVVQKGDTVSQGDIIITSNKGSAQILMVDGAYFSVRPDTVMKIDAYFYKKEDETGSSIISLLKGCFRSITGMIGQKNKENYKVKTPVANIGIRGTDHEIMYITEPGQGDTYLGEPGVYDKVNTGMTYIENSAGVVEVGPNQVGYTATEDSTPTILSETPDFFIESSDDAETETQDSEGEMESTLEEVRLAESLFDQSLTQEITGEEGGQLYSLTNPTPYQPLTLCTGLISWPEVNGLRQYIAYNNELTYDTSGSFTGWTLDDNASYDPASVQSVELINPVPVSSGTAGHYTETGIEYGTFQVDAIRETLYSGDYTDTALGAGLVHWINGPLNAPYYLAQVISGSFDYTFDGGTNPTNQNGISGVLNSASLNVDFTNQNVDASIDLTLNSRNWVATATDMPLDGTTFMDSSSSPSFTIVHDNSGEIGSMPWGYFMGSLTGEGLNGGILSYTLGDAYVGETISGTASFYGTAQNTETSYRTVGFATNYDRTNLTPALAEQSFSAPGNITTDGLGNITGFDTAIQKSATSDVKDPVHLSAGTSVIDNTGYDAETGMSWGRWANDGSITSTDRVTGSTSSPTLNPEYLHFIAGSEMSSSITLPISGEYTYNRIGNTNPTDNIGNTGTLNSATLAANFTQMTVDTSLNVSVGSTTFDASASNIAIQANKTFTATSNDALSVSCTGTGAGTTHSGSVSGAFHGSGGEGVGMVYSLNTTDGSTIDTTVSGAVAFKR